MSATSIILNEILTLTAHNTGRKLSTLAIFDLDSTLFNVSTRTQKIIDEFGRSNPHPLSSKVIVETRDWGIKESFLRAGFSIENDRDYLIRVRDYWRTRFFSGEYLHFDTPYPGAINFTQDLERAGCEIMYLTGRADKTMRSDTISVLKKWGFPVFEKNLFLKPSDTQEDELYKNDWFRSLDMTPFENIFFFENEPVNINAVKKSCPEVEIIFLDTTHARRETVPAQLKTIEHFVRSQC